MPPIVQGGMGIAVSGWPLASAVSRRGQFGIVSGSGIALSFVRRLRCGDPGSYLHEALAAFPVPELAQRVLARWHPLDTNAGHLPSWPMPPWLLELLVVANFAEVYLAKSRGGSGPVGLNLLTKTEIVTLPSLYGAMLAGVDAVFMGAGVPRLIPGALDALARGIPAAITLTMETGTRPIIFDPAAVLGRPAPQLKRPAFFPIVASESLATILMRKSNGALDGFVIEDHSAGGHNAPPRRSTATNGRGEPVWGDFDRPSLAAFCKLGLPFYVAGGKSDATALRAFQAQGASGVQIGTAFAFCDESGILSKYKEAVILASLRGDVDVFTDANASPTGFPFKVVQLAGTLSESAIYNARPRACEAGYLRNAYQREDGTVGWRCPAERETAYLSKGGNADELTGRKCLCAGLSVAAGIADSPEPALITAGHDVRHIARYLAPGHRTYSANDVISAILGQK